MTTRRTRIYEGKAKILYEGPEPGTVIVHFKDDATAFNAQKKAVIEGKGVLNQRISEFIFSRLNDLGIPTHFMRSLNLREQLVREVEIIPLEVIVRNVAAGSLATKLGLEEGYSDYERFHRCYRHCHRYKGDTGHCRRDYG